MIEELREVLSRLPSLIEARKLIRRRPTWLVGNGGSAAVASHVANDMVRVGIPAVALVDPPTLTANANDFGYGQAYARLLAVLAKEGDLVVAVSSSGQSENILEAARTAKARGCDLLTLSAFNPRNPLAGMGAVNLHVETYNYGVAEVAHLTLLHELVRP